MTDPAEVAPAKDAPTSLAALEVQRLKAAARAKLFGDKSAPLQISRYTILRQLGVGGMGEVFLAYDAELGRKVAIKLVRLDRERGVERASSRLLREAQALARLSHPNVVQVYEVGHYEGRVFIAMEFVHGVHMRRWLEAGQRSWRQVLDMYLQAGQGLAAAHRLGMVHRDFKPENILVGDDGRVRVVDFGLVRSAPDAAAPLDMGEGASAEDLERSSRLTQSGAMMGTPTYMSPEQFQGLKATAKSDQFAFCVALYRGLYGWHPFAAETRIELKRRVMSGQVAAPPRDAKVPQAIYNVLLRGLQVDPEQRFPSMEALLTALAAPPRRHLGLWAATAGAALFGALVAWFAWPDGQIECDPEAPFAAWGPPQRDRLAAAFARTGLAYAASATEHASARLDRATAELQATRAAVCAAPLADPFLAARQSACLDRRARELAVVAGALVEAEAPLVERSALLVESLPSLAPCHDVEALAGGPPPPPDTPAAVEARGWVDEARTLSLRGNHLDAERRAEHAHGLASRLDDGPLKAEVRAAFARAWLGRSAREQGLNALHDALELAESHRHDELTAELWLTLTRLAAERGDATEGLAHARRAQAALRRLGDPSKDVELDVLRGELMLQLGRHTDGEMALQRALNAAGEHPALATRAELLLARALLDQHRDREAAEHLDRGLNRVAGFPRHPDAAAYHEQLARLRKREGRIDQARDHLQVALQIRADQKHSPEHLARVHISLAELSAGTGDSVTARRHFSAALALAGQHPQILTAAELARAEAGRATAAP